MERKVQKQQKFLFWTPGKEKKKNKNERENVEGKTLGVSE